LKGQGLWKEILLRLLQAPK